MQSQGGQANVWALAGLATSRCSEGRIYDPSVFSIERLHPFRGPVCFSQVYCFCCHIYSSSDLPASFLKGGCEKKKKEVVIIFGPLDNPRLSPQLRILNQSHLQSHRDHATGHSFTE